MSSQHPTVSIAPLLVKLSHPDPPDPATAQEIAAAIALVFTNQLSGIQCGSLLTLLSYTGRAFEPAVIRQCAARMREAVTPIDISAVEAAIEQYRNHRKRGTYRGGLCDIVGTGGDGKSTFNISTTASLIAASQLLIAKHGARASTSKSGSADVLEAIKPLAPKVEKVDPTSVTEVFRHSPYAFLFASTFHQGMRHVAPIRKELGFRTIFNFLGPLANPLDSIIEARVLGVAKYELGFVYAEALRLNGAKNSLVVCGEEDLDEISCAGPTHCWRVMERPASRGQVNGSHDINGDSTGANIELVHFEVTPEDFGLPRHHLSEVLPGMEPHENAEVLLKILNNDMAEDNPTLQFVLINAAALFALSGICEGDESPDIGGKVITERGPGGLRFKEGVRRARYALKSGGAREALQKYTEFTNRI
jgi:anthranilate phosphoribosyltransferase